MHCEAGYYTTVSINVLFCRKVYTLFLKKKNKERKEKKKKNCSALPLNQMLPIKISSEYLQQNGFGITKGKWQ